MIDCPFCGGKMVEIFSTSKPVGYTGVYKCIASDCGLTFDPTFADEYFRHSPLE